MKTYVDGMKDDGPRKEVHHQWAVIAKQISGVDTRGVKYINTLVSKADEVQELKYVVHNVAHAYGFNEIYR